MQDVYCVNDDTQAGWCWGLTSTLRWWAVVIRVSSARHRLLRLRSPSSTRFRSTSPTQTGERCTSIGFQRSTRGPVSIDPAPIATDGVAWFACLCVCWSRHIGEFGKNGWTDRKPHANWQLGKRLTGPLISIGSQCLGVLRSTKINNSDSGTAAAACNAPDWSVSRYTVPREKSAPLWFGLSSKFWFSILTTAMADGWYWCNGIGLVFSLLLSYGGSRCL